LWCKVKNLFPALLLALLMISGWFEVGRRALTPEEHALKGTRPTRAKPEQPSSVQASRPKLPSHLTKEARREWKRVLPLLLRRGSLTESDGTALALYAETFARWVAAKKEIEERGIVCDVVVLNSNGQPVTTRKTNPALKIAENCERSLGKFLKELGLTPASRERVKPARKTEEDEPLPADSVGAMYGLK
jgi:P27 family predicted phage terminase small subunit